MLSKYRRHVYPTDFSCLVRIKDVVLIVSHKLELNIFVPIQYYSVLSGLSKF